MKKLSEFEQACRTINDRLHGVLHKNTARKYYYRAMKVGAITRTWHKRRIYYCSECGQEIHGGVFAKECPHCHAKWNSNPEPYMQKCDVGYHMVMEAKGDIQLCRVYKIKRTTQFKRKSDIDVWEVERIFYAPNGERKVFSVNFCPYSYIVDSFCQTADWHMRNEYDWDTRAAFRYNLPVDSFQVKSLTKAWRYKDVPAILNGCSGRTDVLRYLAYPWAETWHKVGQDRLLRYVCINDIMPTKEMKQAVNICTRNHYIILDPSMWLDYLDLLQEFHLDTHNAKYVCPVNLLEAHQALLNRKHREEEREWAADRWRAFELREKREANFAKMVANWSQHMGEMLNIDLTGDNLSIRPLQSIKEFKQEGEAMHHCVFAMGYYDYINHPNTLILSAKDDNGKRLATIEYNMASNTIVQCRAACNAVPERYNEICKLITDNKAEFVKLEKKSRAQAKAA